MFDIGPRHETPSFTMEKSSVDTDNKKHRPTPLHVALWNGNLNQIKECLQSGGPAALETRDKRGNRALHLALKFAHRNSTEIVKSLLDAGARVRSRDTEGWKAIHHAVVAENEEILRLLIRKEKEQAPALLQRKIDDICPRVAEIPDFYCEINVNVSTWVPGVSRWLPSDTVKIWKAAQDIRFDITLVGFVSGKWDRGDLSFLLLGSDRRFLCLDNSAKTYTDLRKVNTKLTETDLDLMVHFLITTSIVTTQFDASKVKINKKTAWLSAEPMLQDISCWKDTHVADMNGVEVSLRYRKPHNPKHPPPQAADEHSTVRDAVSVFTGANHAEDHNTEVKIHPQSNHIVTVYLTTNEELAWTFSTDKRDINFGVQFFEENSRERWRDIVPLQRFQAHVKEQTGSYKASSTGTLVLTWDNSYSVIRPKRLKFAVRLVREGVGDIIGNEDRRPQQRVNEEAMTFQKWFGVSIEHLPASLREMRPHRSIKVHAQPSCHKITRSFPATVHLSDQFPLSVSEFLPVIEVLSETTSTFESVQKFFSAALTDEFPVQFCFPLLPSISATFRFDCMELKTPERSIFAVPKHYAMLVEGMLSPRTRQAVLQRLAVT
ncbi:hypothetical protein L915_09437 [Plasmopara halstedii]|uniref:GOLD domain-containing protein n=1 Tax=Plasmopara halstedii TaxID=4781 RepID=A0A0P1ARH1_PLAHL|nr:hypothetical protein L915_09437 [Plasmopara halstedii]CEG44194.1 hypothetical protein L915_09437 [Plasmopara halstedii]|eukprot:XP_024580563.1 hypothetical protein L915_09437 [Plasmopara halstedii]